MIASTNLHCLGFGMKELEILGFTLSFLFDRFSNLLKSLLLCEYVVNDCPWDTIFEVLIDSVDNVTVD